MEPDQKNKNLLSKRKKLSEEANSEKQLKKRIEKEKKKLA